MSRRLRRWEEAVFWERGIARDIEWGTPKVNEELGKKVNPREYSWKEFHGIWIFLFRNIWIMQSFYIHRLYSISITVQRLVTIVIDKILPFKSLGQNNSCCPFLAIEGVQSLLFPSFSDVHLIFKISLFEKVCMYDMCGFNIRVMLASHLTFFIASLLLLCTNHNKLY